MRGANLAGPPGPERIGPWARPARSASGWLFVLLLAVAVACRGSQPTGPSRAAAGLQLAPPPAHAEQRIALVRAALAAGDEQAARALVEQWKSSEQDQAAWPWIESFEHLLRGRELAQSVHARLVARAVKDEVELELWIHHDLAETLTLSSLAGRIGQALEAIDERAMFQVDAHTRAMGPLENVRIPPGMTAQFDLGLYAQPLGTAMAVHSVFRMTLPGVHLGLGEKSYAVRQLPVSKCTTQRLSPRLPSASVDLVPLSAYLSQSNVHTPALVERLVRIDPSLFEQAFETLFQQGMQVDRLVFAARYAPCLRWLSGERELGSAQEAWRAWRRSRDSKSSDEPAIEWPDPSAREAATP